MIDAEGRYRPSNYDMPKPVRPTHFECRGPACRACEADRERDERNQR